MGIEDHGNVNVNCSVNEGCLVKTSDCRALREGSYNCVFTHSMSPNVIYWNVMYWNVMSWISCHKRRCDKTSIMECCTTKCHVLWCHVMWSLKVLLLWCNSCHLSCHILLCDVICLKSSWAKIDTTSQLAKVVKKLFHQFLSTEPNNADFIVKEQKISLALLYFTNGFQSEDNNFPLHRNILI